MLFIIYLLPQQPPPPRPTSPLFANWKFRSLDNTPIAVNRLVQCSLCTNPSNPPNFTSSLFTANKDRPFHH